MPPEFQLFFDRSFRVAGIRKTLKDLGYGDEMDGFYGEGTVEAMKRFQRVMGLGSDGPAGARSRFSTT